MAELQQALSSPIDQAQRPQKKRKLKHPRASRACAFCRRRKIRCTGEAPTCAACKEEDIECKYESMREQALPRSASPIIPIESRGATEESIAPNRGPVELNPLAQSSRNSRRNSQDASATFDRGLHIGSNSGVSFLYRWQEGSGPNGGVQASSTQVPLVCHGDPVPIRIAPCPYPEIEDGKLLLDHYFRFATPTYRFLHRPSVEDWMKSLIHNKALPSSKAACVLLVWSQALLLSPSSEKVLDIERRAPQSGQSYYQQAKWLLENEPGPATLSSVQARTAVCLYLLGTSRVNECRFVFGFTTTLVTALGLHRRYATKRLKLDAIETEGCKRVFWCIYVVDGYLSVILGRPRSFQEKDFDQEYPINIDDDVLEATTDVALVPHHGNLEAAIHHCNLARVMARNNDVLYSLTNLTEPQLIHHAQESLRLLQDVENALPHFLKPREPTLVGSSMWERQNTVLKLALAHARVLATRRCILTDDSGRTSSLNDQLKEQRSRTIQICMDSITTIVDVAHELMQRDRLYEAFWFTQYIALCAISTLFMYKIQCSRSRLRVNEQESVSRTSVHFRKAEDVQQYLARIAQPGSLAQRHHDLLNHLRNRANNKNKPRQSRPVLATVTTPDAPPQGVIEPAEDGRLGQVYHIQNMLENGWNPSALNEVPLGQSSSASLDATGFTPSSSADFNLFEDATPWQYLDQLGAFGGEQATWFYHNSQ